MKRWIHAASQIGTYKGVPYGIEDDGDQRFYFRNDKGEFEYADLEEELFAKIDKMKEKSSIDSSTDLDDEDDEWGWSPFHGGIYRIDGQVGSGSKFTDDPKEAITWWFKMQKKAPMDVSISCQKKDDALALVKAGTVDLITNLASKYKTPYDPEWIIEQCAKKVADKCAYFHEGEYGDSVHPFGVG